MRRPFPPLAVLQLLLSVLLLANPVDGFSIPSPSSFQHKAATIVSRVHPTTALHSFFGGKKDDEEDLSFIETRDMTREEMQEYNQRFEDTVNQEMVGMTVFSLIISLPLLYLAWVGLFSETAEIASDFSDLPYN